MKRRSARIDAGSSRVAFALALSLFVASCSTAGGPPITLGPTGFAASSAAAITPVVPESPEESGVVDGTTDGSAALLPQTVAFRPSANPLRPNDAVAALAAEAAPDGDAASLAATDAAPTAQMVPVPLPAPSATPNAPAPETEIRLAAVAPAPEAASDGVAEPGAEVPIREAVLTADHSREPVFQNPGPTTAKKPNRSLFAAFFGSPKPAVDIGDTPRRPVARQAIEEAPVVLASAKPESDVSLREALTGTELPGVRKSALFEITRRSGLDDDSDVDLNEDIAPPVRVASAAGLARLAPNGLLVQHEGVDTACLNPALVKTLKQIERHYGSRVVVTSGFRSPSHNRRVRGARKSLHMACAAADIQIAGVGKWELARYARSMSNRGGVGTYCHTESVHIDIGPERDWNWRCRRSKRS